MADSGISIGEQVLGGILDLSHRIRPDEIQPVTIEAARRLGAGGAWAYLADMDQRWLVPMAPDRDRVEIDATVAGRAFRTGEVVRSGSDLWLPLLDGADRVGVLHAVVDGEDEARDTRLRWLSTIVAELIVAKSAYGDELVVLRRTEPMTLAAELRWALLPPLTYMNDIVEVAAILEPAHDVAGDAFDYSVSATHVDVAIFDAMGHGLEASRMANLAMGQYRNARREGFELEETYRAIDQIVHDTFGSERFVTAQLVRMDLRNGHLRMLTAGHPAPMHLRGARVLGHLPCVVHPPLGIGLPGTQYAECWLEPGDRIVLYSDGVVEARSPDGDEFGIDRLAEFLANAASNAELPAEMLRRLVHRILEHESGGLRDDATLVLLGWKGAAEGGQ